MCGPLLVRTVTCGPTANCGALSRGVNRQEHGTEDSRWSRSAVDIAEPASGLRVYPEAVLVRTETAFGSGVPRRRNNL